MATTEGKYAGEFLVNDEGEHSRENVVVLSGQNLAAGAVVGRVNKGIGRVSIPTVVGTGNGTVNSVFAGPLVEVGNYVATCLTAVADGGVWGIVTPSGVALHGLTMTPGAGGSTVYTSEHINFTIVDGSTNFSAGDVFTFVVSTTVPTVIGGTGTGVLSALTLGPDAQTGNYKVNNDVVVSGGGDMSVIGPDGRSVGGRFVWAASGSTATFTSRQISFTISDATDYIANNHFNIAVFNQLAGGKVVEWDPRPTAYDGRHKVAGIAWDNYDATAADVKGVIVARRAIVNADELTWKSGLSAADKVAGKAALMALGVVPR